MVKPMWGREDVYKRQIFGTGKGYYNEITEKIRQKHIDVKENVLIRDYIENMDQYLMACDLVISHSGALSAVSYTHLDVYKRQVLYFYTSVKKENRSHRQRGKDQYTRYAVLCGFHKI